jgi:hypothetical protein
VKALWSFAPRVGDKLGFRADKWIDVTPGPAAGGIEGAFLLGPLADNAGPTRNYEPEAGSPLVNAAATADCTATDQRGVERPQGAVCDIGAVEVSGA